MTFTTHSSSAASIPATADTKPRAFLPAFAAIILGLLIVGTAGLANPQMIHNAAHDSRHSLAFPCH